ncbi:MAG TPA: hypothetical protein VK947_02065 [Planococcus sp. (in: firmicutes)]|nr:hypothetical protein [Planococcus sp. (in: firmicutes)]
MTNHPGSVSQYSTYYHVSHPSVHYNYGTIRTTVRKDVTAYGQATLRPYMQKNQLTVGTAFVQIFNNNNLVFERSISSGRTVDYKVPGGSSTQYPNYHLRYGTSNKEHWYPRMYYLLPPTVCTACGVLSIGDEKESKILGVRDLENNTIIEAEDNIVIQDDFIYTKQSNKTVNAFSANSFIQKESYTLDEIFAEFYDEEAEQITDQTKTLTPGTKVLVEDKIVGLEYDKTTNLTTLFFNSNHSSYDSHPIAFKGKLTKKYSVGDSINLKFDIVAKAEVNGDTFVDLDYNVYTSETGEFPDIKSFLAN